MTQIKVKDGNKPHNACRQLFWLVITLTTIGLIYLALWRPDILVMGL